MEIRLTQRDRHNVVALRRVRVQYRDLETRGDGDHRVALVNGGALRVEDDDGRVEEHGLRAGDMVRVGDGAVAPRGEVLYQRHGYIDVITAPVPAGEAARVRFVDLIDYVTFREKVDEGTGLSRFEVIASYDRSLRPSLTLSPARADAAWTPVRVALPPGATLRCGDGDEVARGDVVAIVGAEQPVWGPDRRDGTANLPPSATLLRDLFEGRHAHPRKAVVAPASGRVLLDREGRGSVAIESEGAAVSVPMPPRAFTLLVRDGMWVFRGDAMTDGVIDHHDLARALGRAGFAEHLAAEIRTTYALAGVRVRAVHIELAVRALLSRVEVTDPCDAPYFAGEVVDRDEALARNERLRAGGKRPARHEVVLTGLSALLRRPRS